MINDIIALELDPNKQYIFYIEVGKMPPHRVKEKLEEVRNAVKSAGFTKHNFFATMKHGELQFKVEEVPELLNVVKE